ncbi:hypothetical protein DCC81_18185 [Chitinophaga parva]|uniref:Uncharacterized protein n=2 Tax=Chitinophaga parva TaxID=2169414 RepID=A0A2T7BIQ3_9BACT|nr:hypothetical protein DCC81_18185 [Chitinophaga parva]
MESPGVQFIYREPDILGAQYLIARGETDLPVQNAKNMAQYLPNAKRVLYPDAAPAAVFQRPGLFVPAAISFLGK